VSNTTTEKGQVKMTARFKARDLHIIRRAALMIMFPDCPYCGMPNDDEKPFILDLGDGIVEHFDAADAKLNFCHLDARTSENGTNSDDNLCVGHNACNLEQAQKSIEVHCKKFRTAMSAHEIRTLAATAKQMSDDMLAGKLFYPNVAKKALELINAGKPHRTGADWMKKIQAA
jgi:hypothetical protein